MSESTAVTLKRETAATFSVLSEKSKKAMKKRNTNYSVTSEISRKGIGKCYQPYRLSRKKFLQDSKRCIVANIGKTGVTIAEQPYWIYDAGCDITPKIIEDSSFPSTQNAHLQPTGRTSSSTNILSNFKSFGKGIFNRKSSISSVAPDTTIRGMSSVSRLTHATFNDLVMVDSQKNSSTLGEIYEEIKFVESDERDTESSAASMFQLRIDPPPKHFQPPTRFTVNLTETDTIFFLQIPSTAEFMDSEEGKRVVESNSIYEKSLHTTKSISQVAMQTDSIFSKNRKLYKPRNKRLNGSTFVTPWVIYDDYEDLKKVESELSIHTQEEGKVESTLDEDAEKALYNMEFSYLGSVFTNRLLVALMIMERLIINREYKEKHFTFTGLLVQDPLSLEVAYNYSLEHMWTFKSEKIVGNRVVTSMSRNHANPNILAVGYGKFHFRDSCKGLVCIWNVKNPSHPERHYDLEHPVTHLTFNPTKAQILAVTCYNGAVYMIDIISWILLQKASNEHYPLYEALWQSQWFSKESGHVLVTCGKNGKLYRYKKDKFFTSNKILTVGKIHGRIQGVELPRPCYPRKTLTLSPSVEVLVPHPSDPLVYMLGTSDGCVYNCSILNRYHYIWVVQAHSGPVYSIQYNPFCKEVYLTCGADWCVRIWAQGVTVPLVTLMSGMVPVHDAIWSPLHSTVVISITGNQIEIWDLRRSISKPKSCILSPSESINSILCYTANGFNICIGDLEGNVHVMAMTEMPFSPMYQENILVQAIKVALASHPDLLKTLEKFGKPFSSHRSALNASMKKKFPKLQ